MRNRVVLTKKVFFFPDLPRRATATRQVTQAKMKVAINGFGRIGRNFLRCLEGRENSDLEVVAVNDSGGVKQATHLLKYDSILGTFDADVQILDETTFALNGKPIKVVSSRDPLQLPWKDLGVDMVIEGTGVFLDTIGAGKHLSAGAKKVVITAPAKDKAIPTYVVGVNEGDYEGDAPIVSNASCTTNCLAPFVKVLDEEFGIVQGTMTTTHSYTGDQRLLDASHRDLRRARAAALSIVPTTTGAAKAVSLVLPQLAGKLNGIALRVPTPNVSVVDLVINVEKKGLTAEDVNNAFRKYADGPMKGVLAVSDKPLVSIDYRCSDESSTIDSPAHHGRGRRYGQECRRGTTTSGATARGSSTSLSLWRPSLPQRAAIQWTRSVRRTPPARSARSSTSKHASHFCLPCNRGLSSQHFWLVLSPSLSFLAVPS